MLISFINLIGYASATDLVILKAASGIALDGAGFKLRDEVRQASMKLAVGTTPQQDTNTSSPMTIGTRPHRSALYLDVKYESQSGKTFNVMFDTGSPMSWNAGYNSKVNQLPSQFSPDTTYDIATSNSTGTTFGIAYADGDSVQGPVMTDDLILSDSTRIPGISVLTTYVANKLPAAGGSEIHGLLAAGLPNNARKYNNFWQAATAAKTFAQNTLLLSVGGGLDNFTASLTFGGMPQNYPISFFGDFLPCSANNYVKSRDWTWSFDVSAYKIGSDGEERPIKSESVVIPSYYVANETVGDVNVARRDVDHEFQKRAWDRKYVTNEQQPVATVDAGTTFVVVDFETLHAVQAAWEGSTLLPTGNLLGVPCDLRGAPDGIYWKATQTGKWVSLKFVLDNAIVATRDAVGYNQLPDDYCVLVLFAQANLHPGPILGLPFIAQNDVIFDYDNLQVGLANKLDPTVGLSGIAPTATPMPSTGSQQAPAQTSIPTPAASA
ncbi:hypothetical protein PYCC9005_000931 [Savitreella phatthalungensis]